MRKRCFAYATILILCCSLSLKSNITYGEQRISLVRPVGAQYPISQPFGPSSDHELQMAYKGWGYEGHFGIDYACPVGTDIFACDDGEVFEVNSNEYNGLYVRIKHKWGSSVYLHLKKFKIKNGERVLKHQVIGYSGQTGYATKPHLHFSMRISGIPNPGYKDYVNPQKYAIFESPVTQLSTSKITEQNKLPEVAKSPEYSQETLRLRERIKVYKNKLESTSSQLLRNIPNPPSIEFKLTASEEVNAWADGRITMGLMDFLYSNPTGNPDDQLAMVMAHIITHEKLQTENVNTMLEEGLRDERVNLDNKMAIFDIAFSVLKFFGPVSVAADITKLGGEKVGKAVYDWQAERILEALQKKQENTSHFFSILYVSKAGFDASEGLKIFNNPTAFSRQHPIDRQFWEDYAKEVQAKLDNERQLAAETLTEQKKPPEVAKLSGYSQETLLPGNITIEDGFIKQKGSYNIYLLLDGKKYLIPDRATLNSLNLEKQSVRALTPDVFNSIPEGNSVEAKEIFALRKKEKLSSIQEVEKLPSTDQRLYGPVVQKLPSTKESDIPQIYTKTNKKIEEPSTKSNFVIPEVYNKEKGFSSQNVPSYGQSFSEINNLNAMNELQLLEIEILEELTKADWEKGGQELRKALDKNPMDAFANSTGYIMSGVLKNNPSLERKLKQYQKAQERLLKTTKQALRQQLTNQQYGLDYNQYIPYQTTPMISRQNKEKSDRYADGLELITQQDREINAGYTDGIDRIKNNSTSDFNIQSANIPINEVVLQPGPGEGKDIWTTSAYSYAPGGGGPGGGRDNEWLEMGGWGDSYHILIEFDLTNSPPIALSARIELFVGEIKGNGTTGVYVDRITDHWDWRIQGTGLDHERLWWADRPSATQWTPSPLPAPAVGQWYSIDVTNLYKAWKDDTYPNYGIQLRPVSNDNRWNKYFSSDYMGDPSLRPKLVIRVP